MKNLKLLILLPIILLPQKLHALQRVILPDNGMATVEISANDFNRIKLSGTKEDKILKVRANRNELEIDFEPLGGEVYVKIPVASNKKPINIFILTKNGKNYKLILVPKRIPAEQIFISNQLSQPNYGSQKIYASYSDELINIYKKISRGDNLNCETSFKQKSIFARSLSLDSKVKDLSFIRVERSVCEKYTIEKHLIKNTGDSQIVIRHEDFNRPGVRAIKLNGSSNIKPKESRELYLIY